MNKQLENNEYLKINIDGNLEVIKTFTLKDIEYQKGRVGGKIPKDCTLPEKAYFWIGDYVTLGNRVTLGNYVTLGDWVTLGDYVTLGNRVTLGNDVTLGNYVTLDDEVTLGNYVTLGNGVTLGDGVTLDNGVDHFQLNNQGTSKRSLVLHIKDDQVCVSVGCQCSITYNEFLERINNSTETTTASTDQYKLQIPVYEVMKSILEEKIKADKESL